MIIFGTRLREKDYGAVYPIKCPNCGDEVTYHAVKIRRWYHIYWVPLIPTRATRILDCPECNVAIETDKEGLSLAIDGGSLRELDDHLFSEQ